jgi:hypothetical protein
VYASATSGTTTKGDDEQQRDRDPVLQDRKDLLVGAVGRLELAVLAVQHGVRRDR